MTRTKSKLKFINFHGSHTCVGSPFDGFGYPEDHYRFAWDNGQDAIAITEHGNLNSLVYQIEAHKKMQKEGKPIKSIFGVESYFIPSITEWKKEYEAIKSARERQKKIKKTEEATAVSMEDEQETRREIKSILSRRSHLLLIVQNQTGLNNLFKLVSDSYKPENFYRFPRMDYAALKKYNEGIFATSGCLGGFLSQSMWKHKDQGKSYILDGMRKDIKKIMVVFDDGRFFGELQWNNVPEQHLLNECVIELSKEFGYELISTVDAHYPTPEAWKYRELYKRIGWVGKNSKNKPDWLSDILPESTDEIGYELYPKNGDQMWDAYKKYSTECNVKYNDDIIKQSIENTYRVWQERVEDFMPDNTVRLPDFVVPKGETADKALRRMTYEGLKRIGREKDKEYINRLEEELEVISSRDFSKYFLTVKSIVDKASKMMLQGPGRGSCAGSLLAYVLKITQVDSIRWDLPFSRFLRKDATDIPDVDLDFSRPTELKDRLIEDWGQSNVVKISNWNTLQLRSLIKDISKFYNIPWSEVNNVTGKMLFESIPLAKKAKGIKAGVYVPTFEETMMYSETLQTFMKKYPVVKENILNLYGQTRQCSTHAGGIIVGEDLDKRMPLINSGGTIQSPWAEGQQNVIHLQPMGFIKFDILGLASLRMIETCIRHILKRHHNVEEPTFDQIKEYYNTKLHPDIINFDDQKVWKNVFHKGKFAGIFQFTELFAQKYCKQVKPTNINELMACTAIMRPGPLASGVDKMYLKAKNNPKEIEYLHPIVEEVLGKDYGFIIYQESLATLAHKLGKNISLDDGNTIRKMFIKTAVGKKQKKELKRYEEKFIEGCIEKGILRSDANDLWTNMQEFSKYGFSSNHCCPYCMISYQCAHLLTHYFPEWVASFLDKEPQSRKEKAINIAKSLGFNIAPCDINTSGKVWEVSEDGKTLIQPLTSLLGLGETAVDEIIANRPFNKIEDMLFNPNIIYRKLNKRAINVLIKTKTLECLMDDRFEHQKHFWCSVAYEKPSSPKKLVQYIEQNRGLSDFTEEEKIDHKIIYTGIFPMNLIMTDKLLSTLKDKYIPAISEYNNDKELYNGSPVWFIPREIKIKKTKNGKDYYQVSVIDGNSVLTTIRCWGIIRGKDEVYLNRPYLAKLNYDETWGWSSRGVLNRNWRLLG